MSSPVSPLGLRTLALSAFVALAAFVGSTATATAATGELQWTQTKVYETSAPPNTNRTWLGYLARNGAGPMFPNGSASATNEATGPTVDASSAAGATSNYTWSFKNVATPATLEGKLTYKGTLLFTSVPHSINIAINDPAIEFKADKTGTLVASGTGIAPNPMAPGYSPTDPNYSTYSNLTLFTLDAKNAVCTLDNKGVKTLANVVPALAAPKFFTGSYAVGSGPDRTPLTFGSFTIVGAPCADKDLANAKLKSFKLKKPPFKTRKTVTAKLTRGSKFVGYASVKNRRLKATYLGTKLKGKYKLTAITKSGNRNKRFKTVVVKLG